MIKIICLSLFNYFVITKANDLSGFDDSILHAIKWPGTENIDVVFLFLLKTFIEFL